MSLLTLKFLMRINKIYGDVFFFLFSLLDVCRRDVMSIEDKKSHSWANPHVVDRLCQANLHRRSNGRSSLRRVLFLGWEAEVTIAFSHETFERPFCHENFSNHDSPVFLFPCVQSLFHSRCLYPLRLHDSVARYCKVRVRARPKKRREKKKIDPASSSFWSP